MLGPSGNGPPLFFHIFFFDCCYNPTPPTIQASEGRWRDLIFADDLAFVTLTAAASEKQSHSFEALAFEALMCEELCEVLGLLGHLHREGHEGGIPHDETSKRVFFNLLT